MASSHLPPVPADEPDVCVPASLVGGAAEILALVGDMAGHDRDGTFRARVEDFMEEIGAEPRAAADWLLGSVRRLAREAEEALAREGVAVDRELPCYWRSRGRG